MLLSLTSLAIAGLVFLAILFGSAWAAEKGWIPRAVSDHHAMRALSCGVFVGVTGFFAVGAMAADYGTDYLLYYAGASAAFFIAPALLGPLNKIAIEHKLGSLADVFAFRYPAGWTGGAIAILMLLTALPLIALQIDVLTDAIQLLHGDAGKNVTAVLFCATMLLFAIAFGARHVSTERKHRGLIVAMAVGTLVKLIAFAFIALFTITFVFGGFASMTEWLASHQSSLHDTEENVSAGGSRVLLLMFFAGVVAMPHVYHMLFTENDDERTLPLARWGMPAWLMTLSLCVPPVLWGAIELDARTPPEFHLLGIGLATGNEALALLALIGGMAAASGVVIVVTLALASMTLNHIALPFYRPTPGVDIYWLLLNGRRLLIALIVLAGYGTFKMLEGPQDILAASTVAFVATLQLLPGLIGVFHWRRANKAGLFAGLASGYLIWLVTMVLPVMNSTLADAFTPVQLLYAIDAPVWQFASMLSLAVNAFAFILFSLLFHPSAEELNTADECMADSIVRRYQGELEAESVPEIRSSLASVLGTAASDREVNIALSELSFAADERRPHALHQIRTQMESNLASLLGQTIAHRIIGRFLPYKTVPDASVPEHVHSIENRLEEYRSRLTGLAAELDALRRYHRRILQELPVAVCTVGADDRILTWNQTMTEITGLSADKVVGSPVGSLEQWGELLTDFAKDANKQELKTDLKVDGQPRLLNLHKARVGEEETNGGDAVIVVEDITESELMEEQLIHKERLVSIGQLAAGVAHEIGNPVTGIACLAQNIKMESEHEELKNWSSQILDQTERISTIVQSLVNFAHHGREPGGTSVPIDTRQCVDEAINLLSLSQKETKVSFDNRCPPDIVVHGDPQRLSQVFVNLLANARDASHEGDQVIITAGCSEGSVNIDIADRGHGISADHLKRVFEPFYTTKDPGQGTGLGLAIVNSIVEEHNGSVTVQSSPDEPGTHVMISLPTTTGS